MDRAAAEYFGRLPQSAIDSMGVTEADVQHIYEDYGLAEKLAGQLTDNVALEVSDSEAKVIHVSQIKTSDESEADAFQRAASQEDADFQSCAEEAGLTVKVTGCWGAVMSRMPMRKRHFPLPRAQSAR